MRGQVDDCECSPAYPSDCNRCRATYVWTDNSALAFDGWGGAAEPGEEFCVAFTTPGWIDEPCHTRLMSICKQSESPIIALTLAVTLLRAVAMTRRAGGVTRRAGGVQQPKHTELIMSVMMLCYLFQTLLRWSP